MSDYTIEKTECRQVVEVRETITFVPTVGCYDSYLIIGRIVGERVNSKEKGMEYIQHTVDYDMPNKKYIISIFYRSNCQKWEDSKEDLNG